MKEFKHMTGAKIISEIVKTYESTDSFEDTFKMFIELRDRSDRLEQFENALKILKDKFTLKFNEKYKKVYLFVKELDIHIYTFTLEQDQIDLLKEVIKNEI